MEVEFLKAKNGELTARFNSLFLHSAYSPIKESERSVENLTIPFTPEIIIFVEPCISYNLKYVKQKYNNAKTAVIRFNHFFDEYNTNFDYIFYSDENSGEILSEKLLNTLGEESLCSSFFYNWLPSEKAFSKESYKTWNEIKKATQKAKTYLVTREYFEKKWFLNCCNNISKINNTYKLKNKINLPVAIIASGPSLENQLQNLSNFQDHLFIITLSSALKVCLKNNIIPDLCLSTDGGFWAGEHLKQLKKHNIPIAIAAEGFCPSKILKNNQIILLSYNDGLSKTILDYSKVNYTLAQRNGTVSGTALDFALCYSTSDIFFFGLDLAESKGFSHTNPNENETTNSLKENRLFTREKRIFPGTLKNESLEIYKEWFQKKSIEKRNVYRIIEKKQAKNYLNEVKDISGHDFLELLKNHNCKKIQKNLTDFFEKTEFKLDKQNLKDTILNLVENEKNVAQLFPLDYVALKHKTADTNIIQERIAKKISQIKNKIGKLFNDN